MTRAFVLMTALPPTYGHLDLIQFASLLPVNGVTVLLNTQPDEPMIRERFIALVEACQKIDYRIHVAWQNEEVQQEATGPDDQAFWDDWVVNLRRYGFKDGDYLVASESYGVRLAQEANGQFMVYDRDRWVRYTKGTKARNDYIANWDTIIPEFRQYLQKKVTAFGAESTGKTTLTEALVDRSSDAGVPATKLFEWARPYLEMVGPELTLDDMFRIWEGQYALQKATYTNVLNPLVLQDTDLWTTIGFWEDWSPETVPAGIYTDAKRTQSDLYIITRSNIPFEEDPIRYGGNERQTPDEYWIAFAEKYNLPYVVLEENSLEDRLGEAMNHISEKVFNTNPLDYKRIGAEYEQGD